MITPIIFGEGYRQSYEMNGLSKHHVEMGTLQQVEHRLLCFEGLDDEELKGLGS